MVDPQPHDVEMRDAPSMRKSFDVGPPRQFCDEKLTVTKEEANGSQLQGDTNVQSPEGWSGVPASRRVDFNSGHGRVGDGTSGEFKHIPGPVAPTNPGGLFALLDLQHYLMTW